MPVLINTFFPARRTLIVLRSNIVPYAVKSTVILVILEKTENMFLTKFDYCDQICVITTM